MKDKTKHNCDQNIESNNCDVFVNELRKIEQRKVEEIRKEIKERSKNFKMIRAEDKFNPVEKTICEGYNKCVKNVWKEFDEILKSLK